MSWGKLKSKLQEKDLDEEFEKFMNESLSDESLNSPRRSITPKGTRSKINVLESQSTSKFDKPWWATSEDEEQSGLSDLAKKTWLKKKEEESKEESKSEKGSKPINPLGISRDSLDVASRPGTALDTILSEPEHSTYEPSVKSKASHESLAKVSLEDSHKDYKDGEYSSDEDHQPRYDSVSSSPVFPKFKHTSGFEDSSAHAQPGMETLDEIKDKEAFFAKIENEKGEVDYGKLNEEFDEEHEERADHSSDEEGANSNVDDIGLQLYKPNYECSSDEEKATEKESVKDPQYDNPSQKDDSYSQRDDSYRTDDYDDSQSRKDDSFSRTDNAHNDDDVTRTDRSYTIKEGSRDEEFTQVTKISATTDVKNLSKKEDKKELLKVPSMLSKVSLMESLDTTGTLNLAERMAGMKKPGDDSGMDGQINFTKTTENTRELNKMLFTGHTTTDLADILENLNEQSSQSVSGVEIIKETKSSQPVQSGMLMLDKTQEGSLKVSQFDLQPLVSNYSSEPKVVDERVSLVPDLSKFGNEDVSEKARVIQQEIDEAVEAELSKIASKEFDGLRTYAVPPKSTVQPSRSLFEELQPINTEKYQPVTNLQPIANLSMEDDEEDSSPPTDSLKSIKSIAEERKKKLRNKSQDLHTKMKSDTDITKKTSRAKAQRGDTPSYLRSTKSAKLRVKASQEQLQHMKKISTPINGKTPTKRSPKKSSQRSIHEKKADELLASMETVTSYLKDFTNKKDVGIVSKSFTIEKEVLDSNIAALDREQALQREIQQLRLLFEDERKHKNKLQFELKSQEKQWELKKDEICSNYDRIVRDLHDEIDVMKKKVEFETNDNKHLQHIKNKSDSQITEEDLEKLKHQLTQQETLLSGYQQENERLYNQIKKEEVEKKTFESKMIKENQKLVTELANLREKLETHTNLDSIAGTASLGASRIMQLNNQVKFYKTRESEYKQEILNLENEVASLKRIVMLNERQNNTSSAKDEIEKIKTQHTAEIEKLNKRLKWYSENQQLIDQDAVELTNKRQEIKELRELVERLEEQNRRFRREELQLKNERQNENKKMSDLQRQVKEMEEVIKRRHPNSIPAMIYAASAVPNETKAYENADRQAPSKLFLEKRIKSLEKELEEKDLDNSKKIRAIEQKYNSMSLRYEDHIKQLELKVTNLTVKMKSQKSAADLESELTKTKENYEEIVNDLKKTLQAKQSEIASLKLEILESYKESQRKPSIKKSDKDIWNKSNDKEIIKLKAKLKNKDKEIEDLRQTILALQKERENFLASVPKINSQNVETIEETQTRPILIDRYTSPLTDKQNDFNEKFHSLEKENKKLKSLVEELRLEVEEKRVKCEAVAAKCMNETRHATETYEDKIKTMSQNHLQELQKMKHHYILEHSNSKVAELNGKIASYELLNEHMKNNLEEAKLDRKKVDDARVKEESLQKRIRELESELDEARAHHTPDMHHYRLLQAKIYNMETKQAKKERELQEIIDRVKLKHTAESSNREDYWRDILRNKDLEIQSFREELDAILEVLHELKRQGVILPNNTHNFPL